MDKNIVVIGGESSEGMQRMTRIDERIVASSGKAWLWEFVGCWQGFS